MLEQPGEQKYSQQRTSGKKAFFTQTGVRKAFGAVSSQAENQRMGGALAPHERLPEILVVPGGLLLLQSTDSRVHGLQ